MVLKSRVRAPDWSAGHNPQREAKCRKFPLPHNHNVTPETDPWFLDQEEATHVCNGTYDNKVCPFRAKCLEIALINNEQDGTFGGMTLMQRRWIRRNRELIPRDTWDESEYWRHLVPPPHYFDQTETEDDYENTEEPETEADAIAEGIDRVEEEEQPVAGGHAAVLGQEEPAGQQQATGCHPPIGDGEGGLVSSTDPLPG